MQLCFINYLSVVRMSQSYTNKHRKNVNYSIGHNFWSIMMFSTELVYLKWNKMVLTIWKPVCYLPFLWIEMPDFLYSARLCWFCPGDNKRHFIFHLCFLLSFGIIIRSSHYTPAFFKIDDSKYKINKLLTINKWLIIIAY